MKRPVVRAQVDKIKINWNWFSESQATGKRSSVVCPVLGYPPLCILSVCCNNIHVSTHNLNEVCAGIF